MKIGVVCSSDERYRALQRLVGEHLTYRVPPDGLKQEQGASSYDWVFVDGLDYSKDPSLADKLEPNSFVFSTGEPMRPCVIRHDESGQLQLQCGRQADAQHRAEQGLHPVGTITIIFQHTSNEE